MYLNLAVLADDEGNAVRVTVFGPSSTVDGALAAEIAVNTPFVAGRLALTLWRSRLEAWGSALDALAAGEDATWLGAERGPTVSIVLAGERDCPEIVVADELGSMASVRVPVDLPADWIENQRRLLGAVLDTWGRRLG
jgi:hypothetical protein